MTGDRMKYRTQAPWSWLLEIIVSYLITLAVLLLAIAIAHGQHDHHRFHAFYQNWINKDGAGCCNDRDCRTISDADVKETADGTSVRIEGELCPVLSKHYLQRGNAPDWGSAHICVQPRGDTNLTPCQRLLCYQPKPLS